MSRKPENTFVRGVHTHLPPRLYRVKMANPYNSGVADWWYSGWVTDLWIEYKYIKTMPVTRSIKPDLSDIQANWVSERYYEGRNVRVVVGCPEGAVVFQKPLEWNASMAVAEFESRIVSRRNFAELIMETVGGSFEAVAKRREGDRSLPIDRRVTGDGRRADR